MIVDVYDLSDQKRNTIKTNKLILCDFWMRKDDCVTEDDTLALMIMKDSTKFNDDKKCDDDYVFSMVSGSLL